ncbi:oligopeptide/dipeptide ABC transporter ATP-binding protein [Phyllobacterium sp. K27]
MTDARSPALVSLVGLNRMFGGSRRLFSKPRTMYAVSDVSLQIERGSVTGVVGESGCGKSTLARLALRLIDPTSGSVMFEGIDVSTLPPKAMRRMRQRMQMVFQDPYSSIDPRYRLRDALIEPFRLQGIKMSKAESDAKVAELLLMVGLSPELAHSYPHQLSGGQKQRAGIARALALQPDFLVLDEPTASLDVSIQAQIVGLLEKLKEDLGLTYLFISHDLGLVRYFSDTVVVMYLGRVVEQMPDSKAMPRHPYTKALLDSTFEPDPKLRRLVAPPVGEIPSSFDLPPGCAYSSRCPYAQDRCTQERPQLLPHVERSDEPTNAALPAKVHPVACHFPLSPNVI